MIMPASAVQTYSEEAITSFDMEAPDGYLITTINLDNIEPNFNSTVDLDAFGKGYYLTINNTKNIGWWTYDITLTYPDGSTNSTQLETFQPFATDSDIKIQYFYPELDSIIDVDVYVGILPLTAQFTNPVSASSDIGEALPEEYTYTRIAYSQVTGSSNKPFDLKLYYSTEEEFKAQQDESVLESISGATELFSGWLWDNVIGFIGKIPGVGPYLEATLTISVSIIDNTFFYINLFFVEYAATTILTIEFFILSSAVIKTKKRSNVFAIIDKVVSGHVAVIEFVYKFAAGAINIFLGIVRMVASIVQAIKPI